MVHDHQSMKCLLLLYMLVLGSALNANAQHLRAEPYAYSVATTPFWDNWYVQAGVDMTLQNPYGENFGKDVFPNGKTYGINVALGKWFTPEMGVRFRISWDNWLIKNNHLSWVAPWGCNGKNYAGGGFGELVGEMHFNLTNIFCGYDENRRWHVSAYPRAGLVSNIAIGSCSPLVGFGLLNTWKLNRRLNLCFDVGYQMSTSEFMDGNVNTGMGTGSNGFLNIDIGIQIHLGFYGFSRVEDIKSGMH